MVQQSCNTCKKKCKKTFLQSLLLRQSNNQEYLSILATITQLLMKILSPTTGPILSFGGLL